jgi:chlorophyll synthase
LSLAGGKPRSARWVLIATALGLVARLGLQRPAAAGSSSNGWLGCAACGLSYEGLAWVTGAAVMLGGALPGPLPLALALLYSVGAHGIMTLNDFKAIKGDSAMGIRSLPVSLGPDRAAVVASAVMAAPQVVVIAVLLGVDRPWHALAIAVLLVAQLVMMRRFIAAPVERALWYSGFGVPLFVSGMMVAAVAVRSLPGGL